jgi:hypothetical protein
MQKLADQGAEQTVVSTFVEKSYRTRLLDMIGNQRARPKLVRELLDLRRLDTRFVSPIPHGSQSSREIHRLLRDRGAPTDCYIISENTDWDATHRSLTDAISLVVGAGWTSLIVCRPGSLLYYEGEALGARFLVAIPSTRA